MSDDYGRRPDPTFGMESRSASGRARRAPVGLGPPAGALVRAVSVLLSCAAVVAGFYFLAPVPDPLFPDDYSTIVTDRNGEILRVYLNRDEQWIFPPDGEEIPWRLRETVIAFEDRFFYRHPGVNPGAVLRALYQNVTAGRRVSGASTITMQVARLMAPKPRTVTAKLTETVQALAIELRYSKDEILHAYLDHAPYGGNIRGYRAAALKYFGKKAEDLTWAEAATLAVLPNAPRLAPESAEPAALEARRNELLSRLVAAEVIDDSSHALARAEPVPTAALPIPVWAPHACDRARAIAFGPRIRTTIDLDLQRRLESIAGYHSRYLAGEGIENVAALVADTRSGEVVAYLGSADYFDYSVKGHIDGVQSPRSTGSILKPFLYSLAMDRGVLIPQSLLRDVPTQIGAYAPQNIDRRFRGLVSAEVALVESLNVPAVRLLLEYGLDSFYYFLKDAGLDHLFRRPEDYGLPLVLGGAEATPWEIAGLYRGLATGGEFEELRLLPGAETHAVRLLSRGAAHLTLDVLREVRRPGAEAYWQAFAGGVPVAWKTGTSYGRRDAWAVGVTPRWTVVVWAGNFTGEANPNLSSTTSAGYLLFEILNSFPTTTGGARTTWFSSAPGSLREVQVCTRTGYRATVHCEETTTALVPASAPPLAECPFHVSIYTTADGEYRVDSRCWTPGEYRRRSVLVFPPEVAQHLRVAGLEPSRVPPWLPECAAPAGNSDVAIAYPAEGALIFLPRDLDGSLQKVTLRAAHRDGKASVFWYVGSRYLGKTTGDHKMSVSLERGAYTLTCVDESGGRASVRFAVDVEDS